jgi:3-oxoacid CoA-transferase subunit A
VFAKDGEIYEFAGQKCLVIGGAYSVDKHIRISMNYSWWTDEQPGEDTKNRTEQHLEAIGWEVDVVLTHTCPFDYLPREMFVNYVKQEDVDNSTEHWLNGIEKKLKYKKWYCGHYHTDKVIDKIRFMHHDFIELQ